MTHTDPGDFNGDGAVEFFSFSRVADLNGDGLLDLVSGNTLYLAKAGGGFQTDASTVVAKSPDSGLVPASLARGAASEAGHNGAIAGTGPPFKRASGPARCEPSRR